MIRFLSSDARQNGTGSKAKEEIKALCEQYKPSNFEKKPTPKGRGRGIGVDRIHFFPMRGAGRGNRRREMLHIISMLSHYLTKCSKNG